VGRPHLTEEKPVGFVKKAIKVGLLAKAVDLARRPENQAKIKQLIGQAKNRGAARR
jgi:hypothetical protein